MAKENKPVGTKPAADSRITPNTESPSQLETRLHNWEKDLQDREQAISRIGVGKPSGNAPDKAVVVPAGVDTANHLRTLYSLSVSVDPAQYLRQEGLPNPVRAYQVLTVNGTGHANMEPVDCYAVDESEAIRKAIIHHRVNDRAHQFHFRAVELKTAA